MAVFWQVTVVFATCLLLTASLLYKERYINAFSTGKGIQCDLLLSAEYEKLIETILFVGQGILWDLGCSRPLHCMRDRPRMSFLLVKGLCVTGLTSIACLSTEWKSAWDKSRWVMWSLLPRSSVLWERLLVIPLAFGRGALCHLPAVPGLYRPVLVSLIPGIRSYPWCPCDTRWGHNTTWVVTVWREIVVYMGPLYMRTTHLAVRRVSRGIKVWWIALCWFLLTVLSWVLFWKQSRWSWWW